MKRQRVSEAIGSIGISTDAEQRQEYADINAEPRVSLVSLFLLFLKLTDWSCGLDCSPYERIASAPFQLIF